MTLSRVDQDDTGYGISETAALLRQVDQCLGAALRCMAGPPRSSMDGSHILGQLSQVEGQLHRHLAGAREAVRRGEENDRIVATDQAGINGDRALAEYGRARDAIHEEVELHRRNEGDIQEKLIEIRATAEQIRAWQRTWRPIEPQRDYLRRDDARVWSAYPPWSKQSARRELDDLFRYQGQERRTALRTPPFAE